MKPDYALIAKLERELGFEQTTPPTRFRRAGRWLLLYADGVIRVDDPDVVVEVHPDVLHSPHAEHVIDALVPSGQACLAS